MQILLDLVKGLQMKKNIANFYTFTFSVQPAFAYLDPGTGSSILSIIIGFFVAIGVLIKHFGIKIKSFLLHFKNTKKTDTEKFRIIIFFQVSIMTKIKNYHRCLKQIFSS